MVPGRVAAISAKDTDRNPRVLARPIQDPAHATVHLLAPLLSLLPALLFLFLSFPPSPRCPLLLLLLLHLLLLLLLLRLLRRPHRSIHFPFLVSLFTDSRAISSASNEKMDARSSPAPIMPTEICARASRRPMPEPTNRQLIPNHRPPRGRRFEVKLVKSKVQGTRTKRRGTNYGERRYNIQHRTSVNSLQLYPRNGIIIRSETSSSLYANFVQKSAIYSGIQIPDAER